MNNARGYVRMLAVLLLVGLAGVVRSTPARAQVSIAPTALFLTDQERFGAIYVSNQSATPQEVTVDFRFGYTDSDSSGAVFMQYDDSTAASRYSLAEYVRAFPQRFVLPPGETQVVRLTARPPTDLEAGLLWTRVLTTSTPQVAFQDTAAAGIQTRVIFRMQQVTALFYRAGEADAEVQIASLEAARDSAGVTVRADLSYDGNAPYLGSAVLRLLGANGGVLHEERQPLAVYGGGLRRFNLNLSGDALRDEPVEAELTLTPERTDIPPEFLLDNPPVSRKARVVL